MDVKNSLLDKTKGALNAIDNKELKILDKFDAFKMFAESALPNASKERVSWFVSNAITEVRNNKDLMEAAKIVPNQFFGALMKSIQLGLPIGNQYRVASLIPRNDKNTGKSITLQLWTRAYKMLAARSEKYSEIQVRVIYEKDEFSVSFENGKDTFRLIPCLWGEKGEKRGYIAYCRNLKTGNPIFRVYNMEFINKRKDLAMTDKFWNKWEEEMETKTIIGDFCKNWLDSEIEIQDYLGAEDKAYTLDPTIAEAEIEEVPTLPVENREDDTPEKTLEEKIQENLEDGKEKMMEKSLKEAEKADDDEEIQKLFGKK